MPAAGEETQNLSPSPAPVCKKQVILGTALVSKLFQNLLKLKKKTSKNKYFINILRFEFSLQ